MHRLVDFSKKNQFTSSTSFSVVKAVVEFMEFFFFLKSIRFFNSTIEIIFSYRYELFFINFNRHKNDIDFNVKNSTFFSTISESVIHSEVSALFRRNNKPWITAVRCRKEEDTNDTLRH